MLQVVQVQDADVSGFLGDYVEQSPLDGPLWTSIGTEKWTSALLSH